MWKASFVHRVTLVAQKWSDTYGGDCKSFFLDFDLNFDVGKIKIATFDVDVWRRKKDKSEFFSQRRKNLITGGGGNFDLAIAGDHFLLDILNYPKFSFLLQWLTRM
jgi:hypothetical protein